MSECLNENACYEYAQEGKSGFNLQSYRHYKNEKKNYVSFQQ